MAMTERKQRKPLFIIHVQPSNLNMQKSSEQINGGKIINEQN